jgi:hypothetical protein
MHAALRRRRGLVASATTLTLVSSTLTAFALTSQGYPATDVHKANDSVWVTNQAAGVVGRLNQQIAHLDAGALTVSTNFDVLQGDGVVKVYDETNHKLQSLDPAMVKLDDGVALPIGATVAMNAGTITVLDPSNGSLWVESTTSISQFNAAAEKPTVELEKGAAVAIGVDGVVHAVDVASDQLWTIVGKQDGGATSKVSEPLGVDVSAVLITAVGSDGVVFDTTHGDLLLPQHKTAHVGVDPAIQLQQPGPANDRVALASPAGLSLYPLSGGAPKAVFQGGGSSPVQPVWLNGCVHAAWGGATPTYVRACDGSPVDQQTFAVAPGGGAQLVFRVNDGVIALNDLGTGGVWLADQTLKPVDDWAKLQNSLNDQTKGGPSKSGGQAAVTVSKKNRLPVATEDHFGARLGVATTLPVLANDFDPDGDVLVIDKLTNVSGGTATVTGNGQAVQFTFPANATAAGTFGYAISDGNGGTAQTTVTVTPKPVGTNSPPTLVIKDVQDIELGKTLRFNALSGWQDQDGDPLYLTAVSSANTTDTLTFTPDGVVSFSAGDHPGPHDLTISVSDGIVTTPATGTETVNVHAAGPQKPVAHNDYAVTDVGHAVTLHLLANDTDANGDPLRLASVSAGTGAATVTSNSVTGSVTVLSTQPGPVVLTYTIVDEPTGSAPQSNIGRIRVDVQAAAENGPPVAVGDVAAVGPEQLTDVNVLANDTDPDGDILVVQSVDVPAGSAVTASVVGHEIVHLSAARALDAPVTLLYTVSDGLHEVSAPITVVPSGTTPQPPIAVNDQIVVRAGDVATVAVLTNDIAPQGGKLSLISVDVPAPVPPATEGPGTAFIAGDQVRYLAPTQPQQVILTYTIADDSGVQATGQIAVTVTAINPATDKAPVPEPVEARVFAETTVKIPIPLGGVDPDGDSVILLGETTAPSKGRILAKTADSLTYEAYADSLGTDTFSYAVQDPYGKVGESTVQVGISPRGSVNQPPLAVDDVLTARPNRVVNVPVLANDLDPDGDSISFDTSKPLVLTGGVTATIATDHLVVHVPTAPGSYSVQYFITDGQGGTNNAVLSVTTDPAAPTAPPLPHDDYVNYLPTDTAPSVDVDVLKNDSDPDGPNTALTVSIPAQDGAVATVLPNRKVHVLVGAQPRTVVYRVTDADNKTAEATVYVPGQGNQPPQPKLTPPSVTTDQGKPVTIDIAKYAFDPEGAVLRLTDPSKVVASSGTATIVDFHTITFTPAPKYNGGASVTFEVTDGKSVDDALGLKATFSVAIKVNATGNAPPTFHGSLVTVNEGRQTTVDLRTSSHDPDPGDQALLTYGGLSMPTPPRLDATLKGSVLTLSARSPAVAGQVVLQFTLKDGKSPAVPATLTVQIVPKPAAPPVLPGQPKPTATTPTPTKSAAPPPRLARAIADAQTGKQGRPVTVKATANDIRPPGFDIKITKAKILSGGGAVAFRNSSVTWTPPPSFFGVARLTYTIDDTTGISGRTVDGFITITILGKPDAPATPTTTVAGAGSVALTWPVPASNGSKIDKYGITDQAGAGWKCPGVETGSTHCTVSGLTAGQSYQFKVTAHNVSGWGLPGALSLPVTPDLAPNAPTAPTVVYGDGSLTVTWVAPPLQGSAITAWNLQISPPMPGTGPADGNIAGGATLSYNWTGLTNGQEYTFTVAAQNAKGQGPYSAPSATEHPNAKPSTPDVPTALNSGGALGQQVTVSWAAPSDGGDSITGYDIEVRDNGVLAPTPIHVDPQPLNHVLAAQNGHTYVFTVAASNRSGSSGASAPSAPTTSYGVPATIGAVTAVAGDSQIVLNFGVPAANGSPIQKYQAQYANTWVTFGGPGSPVTGLNNGQPYKFIVRACNGSGGSNCGNPSGQSNSVNPHGTPGAPGVQVSNPGAESVHFSWDGGAANGCTFTGYQYQLDGGAWTGTGAPSALDVGGSYNAQHTLSVRVLSSDCGTPTSGQAVGNTGLKALTADATQSFGTCPPNNPPLYCGANSGSLDAAQYRTPGHSSPVAAGAVLHANCWVTGGKVTGTVGGSSTQWVHVVDDPGGAGYPWMSVLYFPNPGSVADGLPGC